MSTKLDPQVTLQRSSSPVGPSSSLFLSRFSRPGPSRSETAQGVRPLLPRLDRLPSASLLPTQLTLESASKNVEYLLLPHSFRSGVLSIKSAASMTLPTPDTRKRDGARQLVSAISSTLQADEAEIQATWIDDSDSDTPLAGSIISRTTQRPIPSASPGRRDDTKIFASSSISNLRLNQSPSSSSSELHSDQAPDIDHIRMSLDRHDKSRRILQLNSGSLIHATMHGFISRVDVSPLRL
jgi:hypothetical protein